MSESGSNNSEVSLELSDVSSKFENTIDDSIYYEDETSCNKNGQHKQNKVLVRDIHSVTGMSKDSSSIIENSSESDDEDEKEQIEKQRPGKVPAKKSSIKLNNENTSDQIISDSDSDIDLQSNMKPRVKKKQIISSDTSDTEAVTRRNSKPFKSSFMRPQLKNRQIIFSDSSDTEAVAAVSNKKTSESSYMRSNIKKKPIISSDSSETDELTIPNKRDTSKSSHISDIDGKTIDRNLANPATGKRDSQTTSLRQRQQPSCSTSTANTNSSTHGNIDEDITNISTELRKSRIGQTSNSDTSLTDAIESDSSELDQHIKVRTKGSRLTEEFYFGARKNILHSTLLEPESVHHTPVNPKSGKRMFNKSIETPRIIKQIKESNTPRNVTIIPSSSSSPESDDDIIDISSDDQTASKTIKTKIQKQTTLDNVVVKSEPPSSEEIQKEQNSPIIEVSPAQYDQQRYKVQGVESELLKARNLLRTVNLEYLPDKGKSIHLRHNTLQAKLLEEVKMLSKMKVTKENILSSNNIKANPQSKVQILSWEEIEAKAGKVQPKTFGKQALSTYNAQKAVTMDRLQQLHGSLKTCPTENDLAEDPKGLKVELMLHQKRALAWMMWREEQKPSGGILADDMGLGKTLTMISLMLKTNETEKARDDDDSEEENTPEKKTKYQGGTLVVCPASLINQWSGELEKRSKKGLASYEMYHGTQRETRAKRLAQHDMVITTYGIVNNECDKNGIIFQVKWRRIVIDEAHQIRNHKSQMSQAVCKLPAKSRWALTGTPVHNKELDMYALLKFLRCSPFDDLMVWKRWVGDKSTGGTERLHTVISSLMLRRTKVELIEKGSLNKMPERKWELIPVELNKSERDVYSKILIFSRTLFAQFLHQRAEKNQDAFMAQYDNDSQQPNGQNQEYVAMRQKLLHLNKLKDIKQHEILVLLLRLRQICCHPSLITGMLHEDLDILGDDDGADKGEAMNLMDQLNKLTLHDDEHQSGAGTEVSHTGVGEEALGLKEAARGVLDPSDPIFSKSTISSKIKTLIGVLKEKVLTTDDKAIIVSQWSSFLQLISHHLEKERIIFEQLDGTVPVNKRMNMVDRFNNPKDRMKVLLLSLTAGGVGLNLVGANHLFLLDLHWNPQLENQAQDRIYRLGQKKDVYVYKLMAADTIEKRILDLQEKKLGIAQSMLTGTKQALTSKLSLQDLKLLFEM
ncbi:hypothetical protein JTB14_026156 [Gonioctena quinquepunctata]|nr:hypothetical protein JTB14_026156 [Gonioctena quinquepunctata]